MLQPLRGDRQFDPDIRSLADMTRHANGTSKTLDDAAGDGEAQSGAGAPGRKEWIEDAREVVRRDADALVTNLDLDTARVGVSGEHLDGS